MRQKSIYLTIDDAPSSHLAEKVDFLRKEQIPAIFYCRGEYMLPHLDQLVYALKQGFFLGNHSYTHPYFSKIDLTQARDEILATEELLDKAYALAGAPGVMSDPFV
jgi:peptidoglycan/xylan/chitin deacetylase (PgdA/CDA1 family)